MAKATDLIKFEESLKGASKVEESYQSSKALCRVLLEEIPAIDKALDKAKIIADSIKKDGYDIVLDFDLASAKSLSKKANTIKLMQKKNRDILLDNEFLKAFKDRISEFGIYNNASLDANTGIITISRG